VSISRQAVICSGNATTIQTRRRSGKKLFGIIPDWRSASSRNRVHVPPESPGGTTTPRWDDPRSSSCGKSENKVISQLCCRISMCHSDYVVRDSGTQLYAKVDATRGNNRRSLLHIPLLPIGLFQKLLTNAFCFRYRVASTSTAVAGSFVPEWDGSLSLERTPLDI
jgi:hypothetical protein